MTTLDDLSDMRRKAGRRYAEAVEELHRAYIDLAAIDVVVMRSNAPCPVGLESARSFPMGGPLALPEELRHPDFPADMAAHWPDEVARRRDVVLRNLSRAA